MDQTVSIQLVKELITYDEIKQPVKTYERREVYAQLRGIARAEWFEAGRNGMNPDTTFIMSALDYQGETIIEWNGVRYGVYRTYVGRNERIELYCEKKGGLQGGTE